jgi:hypothetical protein
LIDHGGHRIVASARLPLNKDTIAIGSNDGGRTFHMKDEEIMDILKNKIAKRADIISIAIFQ